MSLNFAKIDHAAVKVRDLVDVTSYVTAGQSPASMIFVKTLTNIEDGKIERRARVRAKPLPGVKPIDKASPMLLQFSSTANKSSPDLLLHCATGKHLPSSTSKGPVKVKLKSIDFPKLRAGSKALVTETLHFEAERKRG
jgi:hypothetical protein